MQVDAENLMLGSGVPPDAREDTLLRSSLHLRRDVIDLLPRRPAGLSIAVVDACRTSLRAAATATDGFNQVEAPLGCLIVFSTGAGKPAIAPAVETLNTFYTGSLVKLLASANDEISFSDFFRLVKFDVTQTMQNHPVQAIRQFTQVPFIAENTQVKFSLSPRPANQPAAPKFSARGRSRGLEGPRREPLAGRHRQACRNLPPALPGEPADRRRPGGAGRRGRRGQGLAQQRGQALPQRVPAQDHGRRAGWPSGTRRHAATRTRRRGSPAPTCAATATSPPTRTATRAGCSTRRRSATASPRYELAVFYRRQGQPTPAAQYETRARDLGYTPPTSLDNQRK